MTTIQQYCNLSLVKTVDPEAEARKIARETKPRKPPRAPHGQWTVPARVVAGLVTRKWQVSDAVREMIARGGYPDERKAFRGIRSAYYLLLRGKGEA